jgi:ABC-2 type transport system permease protein
VLTVAIREFKATTFTKAFFFGVVVVPLLMAGLVPVILFFVNVKPPPVVGTVAITDRSGLVEPLLRERLNPDALAARAENSVRQAADAGAKLAEERLEGPAADAVSGQLRAGTQRAATDARDGAPRLSMESLPADADPEAEKAPLMDGGVKDGGRLVLIVIAPNAVTPNTAPDGTLTYGGFEVFVRPKLDARVHGLVSAIVRDAVIDARVAAAGEDRARLAQLMRLETPTALAVTPQGERTSGEFQQLILPVAFMLLLWISVMTGGQYLLASTIEEKSNRVMEVLLSAVSPLELMAGKILGQLSAAMVVLLIYSGAGIVALIALSAMYLINPFNLILLAVFFFIAFFCVASLMAAVGAAVTDIHEAQTLLMPVMLVIMTPMFLMIPIALNPDGLLARILSFTPPVGPFVMVIRLSSSSPPALWETLVAILVGVATAYVLLRLAAKVFRIGVLMYGKPPNVATLVKWIRMA